MSIATNAPGGWQSLTNGRLSELTTTLISLLIIVTDCVLAVMQLQHGGAVIDLPAWLQVATGSVLGFYLGKSIPSSVTAHTHTPDGGNVSTVDGTH